MASANALKKSQSHEGGGKNEPPAAAATAASGKKVKDLNEFFRMADGKKVGKAASLDAADHAPAADDADPASAAEEADDDVIDDDDEDEDEDDSGAVDYSGGSLCLRYDRLPPPAVFGDGNPFLMFMCLACLLQHRDHIMEQQLDYQEIAMHFDRMVRRHNVAKTLRLARRMFAEYLNDDWRREGRTHSRRQAAKAC